MSDEGKGNPKTEKINFKSENVEWKTSKKKYFSLNAKKPPKKED